MDTLIAIPALEDRIDKPSMEDDEKQEIHEREDVHHIPEFIGHNDHKKDHGLMRKLKNKIKKPTPPFDTPTSQAETISAEEPGHPSPGKLSRENTWLSRASQDEKSLFGTTRDFGAYTTSIPGKLFKGGYNKFMSSQNTTKQPNFHQNSTAQAKYLAKKIFKNLTGDSHRNTVVESDFIPFFKTAKEASYAFSLFDTDGNGDLTKRELRQGCIRIYRERKNLTRSMRDLSQATGKLDIILIIIFVAIWAIICCAAFGVDVGTDLMPLWSAFVAASFIFGTSASDAFEAIIFVFVTVSFTQPIRFYLTKNI
jgi:Ca2+-binding EF-hand superfamily protein